MDREARADTRFILEATTVALLEEIELGHLASLACWLGEFPGWSGRARVARAYRAGVSAGQLLARGSFIQDASLPIPGLRNRHYICLVSSRHPGGFYTQSASTYFREIKRLQGERFCPRSISHAFGARAEVTAFLAGSGRPWPSEL